MMVYDNGDVRRQDRLLDRQRAFEIIEQSEYGVLSMSDSDGTPYGIPLNYVWDGNENIYIHCAPDGRKLRMIQRNSRVAFCIVGRVELRPELFTTAYESVVMRGRAEVVDSVEERWRAIRLILGKLSADHEATGMKYSEKSFGRVAIIKIIIESFSGKCKRMG